MTRPPPRRWPGAVRPPRSARRAFGGAGGWSPSWRRLRARHSPGCLQFVTSCSMSHACRGSIVGDPMMPAVRMFNRARNLTLILGAVAMAGASLLTGCAAVRPARPSSPPAGSPMSDASAQTVMAEVALKRGDCRAASESYAKAAASSADVPLVRRATQVAMACEHLPAAWAAATRWHALAPQDREGNALYAAVALKLYHTADARTAIREFWRSEERASVATPPAGKAGGPDPATGQDPATGNASPSVPGGASAAARPAQRAARGMGELMALLLEESDAPAVLMAMSGALEPSAHTPETLTLLGELALAAYDAQRAQEYAEQALQHDPRDAAALRVLARAYVVHGDASQALATARKAKADDSTRGGFELAEVLASLDRIEEAHHELELTLAKARLLADHGEADTGLALLASALERHPQHPSIEYDRAVILEQAGHVHESVQALEQMLSERPDDPTLLNALGYTLADHTLELPHAEGLIRRALAVMPDNPAALDSLGWVRFRAGDSKSAVAMLQHAYTLGHDAEIAAHWGEALWASGQRAEARRVWAAALARDPDSKPLKATLKRFLPDAK